MPERIAMAEMSANEWMKENGHRWVTKRRATNKKKRNPDKAMSSRSRRHARFKAQGDKGTTKPTIKEFVESCRHVDQDECIFVPGAQRDVAAGLTYCGKSISSARFMLLLTQGTPKWQNAFATHKCGNGHLSCVNPKHLKWGDPSTNASDAVAHRNCDTVEEKIEVVGRIGL